MSFSEYKWKFYSRITDYKFSRIKDGYICDLEDVKYAYQEYLNNL